MTELEFWTLCNRHDYFYDYSESQAVWQKGRDERSAINLAKHGRPDFEDMWREWQLYYSGKGDKPPKPSASSSRSLSNSFGSTAATCDSG